MITVTSNALNQIKRLITSRANRPLGIKVGINTKGCSGLSYTLDYVDQIDSKDEVFSFDDINKFCYDCFDKDKFGTETKNHGSIVFYL